MNEWFKIEHDRILRENCIYPCGCCDDCPEVRYCDAPMLLEDLYRESAKKRD